MTLEKSSFNHNYVVLKIYCTAVGINKKFKNLKPPKNVQFTIPTN